MAPTGDEPLVFPAALECRKHAERLSPQRLQLRLASPEFGGIAANLRCPPNRGNCEPVSGKRLAAIVRSPALEGQARLFFADLRWPRERPRLNAFCRNAPAVRFMLFTTALIGDLLFASLLSSPSSSFVHGRRPALFSAFFAISLSPFPPSCPSSQCQFYTAIFFL